VGSGNQAFQKPRLSELSSLSLFLLLISTPIFHYFFFQNLWGVPPPPHKKKNKKEKKRKVLSGSTANIESEFSCYYAESKPNRLSEQWVCTIIGRKEIA